jgi:hypothetical protein
MVFGEPLMLLFTCPRDYVIGGTGYLQNPEEVGFGYQGIKKVRVKRNDKRVLGTSRQIEYTILLLQLILISFTSAFRLKTGPMVHLFYDPATANVENWNAFKRDTCKDTLTLWPLILVNIPYEQFSIIQGGDGGMEYPMCTMILGGGDDFRRIHRTVYSRGYPQLVLWRYRYQ